MGKQSARDRSSVVPSEGKCRDCGKERFRTRQDAKAAAKRYHPGDHMRAYRCGNYWHYGHVNTVAWEDR